MEKKGFTLIEVLIVIGVVIILTAIIIVAINPGKQFAQTRNAQRRNDVLAILNSIHQRMTDNEGLFNEGTTCDSLPNSVSTMAAGKVDLCACLVNTYMTEMPYDSGDSSAGYTDCRDYYTGYTIVQDLDGRITVSAPSAELEETISVNQ